MKTKIGLTMNILEAFDSLNKISYKLMRVYWKISDNYRGPGDFDVGLSQFIGTIEGEKLEKELSELTEKCSAHAELAVFGASI